MADGSAAASEGAARGEALERVYVHDVYECETREPPPHRSARVHSFLTGLEPGSLVCDVGCGNGQYLSVNPSVFCLGGDRCTRLATQAHDDNNEVVVCDNLALPFRDEAFDAVVSVAVVHHFATAERRARALRELARVTRIGGRLLLTVWAMEHEGRDFHSQDVLIPWHTTESPPDPPQTLPPRTPDSLRPNNFLSVDKDRLSDAWRRRSRGDHSPWRRRSRGDHSPGSSSLSSPNETCYSFVRRALQRLAGRRTFLHTWSFTRSPTHSGDRDNDGEDLRDARDLPIELRTIDFEPKEGALRPSPPALRTRSLTHVGELEMKDFARSRPSLPAESRAPSPAPETQPTPPPEPRVRPRLVKQKKSVNEEDEEEALDKPTDMRSLVSELPDFKIPRRPERTRGVFKQSSLNEELMSAERLREKERLRSNIQKQASLNEEYLFRRQGTFDHLRDSIYSTSAVTAKKFQSLKNELTNKLKTSTTGMDRVTVIGFVKMLQGWRGPEWATPTGASAPEPPHTPERKDANEDKRERRHSREDGSDSSKDSSLQSDTSVDSEDSFASVIYVPRADGTGEQTSPTPLSPGPTSPRLKVCSLPTSPRVKTAPALPSPRLKHFPTIRAPSSPKSTTPHFNRILLAQYGLKSHTIESYSRPESPPLEGFDDVFLEPEAEPRITPIDEEKVDNESSERLMAEINRDIEEIRKLTADTDRIKPRVLQDVKPYPKITLQTVAELPEIPQWRGVAATTTSDSTTTPTTCVTTARTDSLSADRKRTERIRQVRELLRQGGLPVTNRTSPMANGSLRPPRLTSLELFNPETDDVDSDSSCASSPDSVDSVISRVPDPGDLANKPTAERDNLQVPSLVKEKATETTKSPLSSTQNLLEAVAEEPGESLVVKETNETPCHRQDRLDSDAAAGSTWSLNRLSPCDHRIAEDRRSHTSSSGSSSSLERLSPGRRSKDRSPRLGNSTWSLNRLSPGKTEDEVRPQRSPTRYHHDSLSVSSTDSDKSLTKSESFGRLQANEPLVTCRADQLAREEEREWGEETLPPLPEFAEKLTEKLLHEIDQYSKRITDEDLDISSSSSSEASISLRRRREEEARTQKILDDISNGLQQLDKHPPDGVEEITKLFPKCNSVKKKRRDVDPIVARYREAKRLLKHEEDALLNNVTSLGEETSLTDESISNGNPEITVDSGAFELSASLDTGCSIESEMSVDSLCTDKRCSLRVGHSTDSSELDKMEISPESMTSRSSGVSAAPPLRSRASVDSSDTSASDWSRREHTASTASLASASARHAPAPLQASLSDESACSEGGGAGVLHRYYHVFRQGELDALIDKCVENLHVVASYYDHSSWCVVAEKVQVWTI